MLLDALTNTYLGSRKSKDGDKAEVIKKIHIYIYIIFSSKSGVQKRQKRRDIGNFLQLANSVPSTSHFSKRGFWQEITKPDM